MCLCSSACSLIVFQPWLCGCIRWGACEHIPESHSYSNSHRRSAPHICLRASTILFKPLGGAPFFVKVRERSISRLGGCAPAGGPAVAPVVGRSVSLTVLQFQREDFLTAMMLRLANGVVSIRTARGYGPPHRIACGFTSHARPRNVFLTCMRRLHESELSSNFWIAGSERSAGRTLRMWIPQARAAINEEDEA